MMAKINVSVSRKLLLRKLSFYFFSFNLLHIRQTFPPSKFSLGDWVSNELRIENPKDPEFGKVYKSTGYITGIIYGHPDWRIKELRNGYSYYVKVKPVPHSETAHTELFHESDLKHLSSGL
ncbi:MAG: hypothetical protein AB4041_11020 [Microcystaceae cyanobacterium]